VFIGSTNLSLFFLQPYEESYKKEKRSTGHCTRSQNNSVPSWPVMQLFFSFKRKRKKKRLTILMKSKLLSLRRMHFMFLI